MTGGRPSFSRIEVGVDPSERGGQYQFSPPTTNALLGTVIIFDFSRFPGDHSVTQSTFENPCQPLAGGFNTGIISKTDGRKEWNLTLTDTEPIWFYCGEMSPTPHCNLGMVGVINAPAYVQFFPDFLAAARTAHVGRPTPIATVPEIAHSTEAPTPPGSSQTASSAPQASPSPSAPSAPPSSSITSGSSVKPGFSVSQGPSVSSVFLVPPGSPASPSSPTSLSSSSSLSSTTPVTSPDSTTSKSQIAVIVGSVVGGVVGLCLFALVAFLCWRRRSARRAERMHLAEVTVFPTEPNMKEEMERLRVQVQQLVSERRTMDGSIISSEGTHSTATETVVHTDSGLRLGPMRVPEELPPQYVAE